MPSQKLENRRALGKGKTLTSDEYDQMLLLAEIIESTPEGQRTARMNEHLTRVRKVVTD